MKDQYRPFLSLEASVHTTNWTPEHVAQLVGEDTLICPGCHELVRPEPRIGRGPDLIRVPGDEFCRPVDGSEAVPRHGHGQVCGPVEAARRLPGSGLT